MITKTQSGEHSIDDSRNEVIVELTATTFDRENQNVEEIKMTFTSEIKIERERYIYFSGNYIQLVNLLYVFLPMFVNCRNEGYTALYRKVDQPLFRIDLESKEVWIYAANNEDGRKIRLIQSLKPKHFSVFITDWRSEQTKVVRAIFEDIDDSDKCVNELMIEFEISSTKHPEAFKAFQSTNSLTALDSIPF